MKKILITRRLLRACEERASKNFDAKLNSNDELYSQKKLIELSEGCNGILTSITDKIDEETINKLPDTVKIISNIAVGFGNIDLEAAKKRSIIVTNTPDVLTDATAEIAMLLILGAARRASEGIEQCKEQSMDMVSRFFNWQTINWCETWNFRNGKSWKSCCKTCKSIWNDNSLP